MARGGGVGTKGWKKLRFVKFVFRDDGSKVLYLPPMIAKKVPHLVGREIEIEDTTRSRWTVTVSEVNGSLAFKRGWPKFFSDHRLKTGEVLVFKYIKGSHFVVRIFGPSACDRENFNNEMPRPIKRATRNPGTAVIEDEASRRPQASSGKETTMVDNHVPVIIKGEPLFFDDPPSAGFAPFEAEVKNKLYLELAEVVTSFQRKEKWKIGKVVYLRDSKGRIWPLFYPNKAGVMVLCLNWSNFCNENKIEPGDKCRFEFEKAMPCIVRVEVIHTSAEVPHQCQ